MNIPKIVPKISMLLHVNMCLLVATYLGNC